MTKNIDKNLYKNLTITTKGERTEMMKSETYLDIFYFRVSKKGEKIQDLEHQKEVMLDRFKCNNPLILKEKGSAYQLENIKNRQEFLKLLNICFDSTSVTINDLFLQKYEPKNIRIYVWDLNRLMRNLKFNMLFSVLSMIHNVRIYSFSDKEINDKPLNSDDEFIKLLFAMISAKKAQDYSDDLSKNIKKAFKKVNGVSVSRKGNKLGHKFRDLEGQRKDLDLNEVIKIKQQIKKEINKYLSKGFKIEVNEIVNKIKKDFGILISERYVYKIKNDRG
jgi:hypothetical protein